MKTALKLGENKLEGKAVDKPEPEKNHLRASHKAEEKAMNQTELLQSSGYGFFGV